MVRLHVQHDHKHKHEMDCVQMTNNADTHTIELENEGSRHIASRSLGMFFLDIFFYYYSNEPFKNKLHL